MILYTVHLLLQNIIGTLPAVERGAIKRSQPFAP
jgi:hypothetical protein